MHTPGRERGRGTPGGRGTREGRCTCPGGGGAGAQVGAGAHTRAGERPAQAPRGHGPGRRDCSPWSRTLAERQEARHRGVLPYEVPQAGAAPRGRQLSQIKEAVAPTRPTSGGRRREDGGLGDATPRGRERGPPSQRGRSRTRRTMPTRSAQELGPWGPPAAPRAWEPLPATGSSLSHGQGCVATFKLRPLHPCPRVSLARDSLCC